MKQSFCNELGFDSKGYSVIDANIKSKSLLISGVNTNSKYLKQKLKKIYGINSLHLKIDKERYSIKYLEKLSKTLQKKNIEILITLGGGSIIDFSKRIYHNLCKKNKNIKFYIFPSIPGSGAESSLSSIININGKKNFLINKDLLPNGVIYDSYLISKCKTETIIMGIIDALTHCIESITTINKNYYLNFLSKNTVNYFIKKNLYSSLVKNKINDFRDISLLSFNGGLAQSNAGSGICHALSHAAEEILNIGHSKCITYFIIPTLEYLNKKNKNDLKGLDLNTIKYIKKLVQFTKMNNNFSQLDNLVSKENLLNNLITKAISDPCWRLYKKNIDINLLKKYLINEKY